MVEFPKRRANKQFNLEKNLLVTSLKKQMDEVFVARGTSVETGLNIVLHWIKPSALIVVFLRQNIPSLHFHKMVNLAGNMVLKILVIILIQTATPTPQLY